MSGMPFTLPIAVRQKWNGKLEDGLKCPTIHFSHWMHDDYSFLLLFCAQPQKIYALDVQHSYMDERLMVCYDDTSSEGKRSMPSS